MWLEERNWSNKSSGMFHWRKNGIILERYVEIVIILVSIDFDIRYVVLVDVKLGIWLGFVIWGFKVKIILDRSYINLAVIQRGFFDVWRMIIGCTFMSIILSIVNVGLNNSAHYQHIGKQRYIKKNRN